MKSYNHLWEGFLSEDNIITAIGNSSKGKRDRKKVKKIYKHPEDYVEYYRDYGTDFYNYKHSPIEIYDGISRKKRQIIVPEYDEQVIHHMAANVLIPIFSKGMYEHVYGSLPKRGAHKAKKTIEKWIRTDPKNCKYCLKMDIKKYFNSIPHDILKEKLARIIHDKKFLKLLYKIIEVQPEGIPLGFYTSQWLANWYLEGLDHYIKEELGAVYYVRYMDDMVIFGPNKKKLHKMREKIEEYLENRLGLKMKENWQVFRFDYTKKGIGRGRHLDFMGFKFYRNKTTIRKSIMFKATRKAKKISKKEFMTIYDARSMLSYLGWIDCTDSYEMYKKWIKPYINFGECKYKLSKYDKWQHAYKKEVEDIDSKLYSIAIYSHAKAA